MEKSETNYYNSVNNLPLENFYALLNKESINWLRVGYSEFKQYDNSMDELLWETWANIHEKYSDLVTNGGGSKDYMTIGQIASLETELRVVGSLIREYNKRPLLLLKIEIEQWGYDADNIEKCLKDLKSLKFKISFMRSKNKDLLEKPEESVDKIEYDLYNDVVVMEDSLGEGRTIDVKTTVVAKWVQYIKLSEHKYKQYKKRKDGRK